MEISHHRSSVKADAPIDGFRDRNSDIRVGPDEPHAIQPRFSDYGYSLDSEVQRGSTGLVYDQAAARISASSDRLLRRGRVNAHSNNRLSSIYGGNMTSWASDRLQNDLSRFSIPEDLEVQAREMPPDTESRYSLSDPSSVTDSHPQVYRAVTGNGHGQLVASASDPEVVSSTETVDEPQSGQPGDESSSKVIRIPYKLSVADSYRDVLLDFLKRYNVPAGDWYQYSISIEYTKGGQKQERGLYPNDKPLVLLREMQDEGSNPQFMLENAGYASFNNNAPGRLQVGTLATPLNADGMTVSRHGMEQWSLKSKFRACH